MRRPREWKAHALPVTGPVALSGSEYPDPTLGADVSFLEAAHREERQPQRWDWKPSLLSVLGATGGHQSHNPYSISLNPLRSALKKPRSPRSLFMSQETPSFVNGG